MRLCARVQLRELMVLVCLLAALFFLTLTKHQEHGNRVPAHANSLVEDPVRRSEALKLHVKDACKYLDFSQNISRVTLSHLVYDDTHKAIYCYMPKVACTSWKRVFLKTTWKESSKQNISSINRDAVHYKPLPFLASSKDREEKLKTYRKFTFVRHPFTRALSAYRDKLEREDKAFNRLYGREIQKKYRGTAEAEGRNVTFPEYMRYISEPGPGTPAQQNEHWQPMYKLCDPCSVDYDFIGTMENLEEDANYVLKWLGMTDVVSRFPPSSKPVNASLYVSKYMKQLKQPEILSYYAKFLPDYLLFDYKFLL